MDEAGLLPVYLLSGLEIARLSSEGSRHNLGQAPLAGDLSTQGTLRTSSHTQPHSPEHAGGPAPSEPSSARPSSCCSTSAKPHWKFTETRKIKGSQMLPPKMEAFPNRTLGLSCLKPAHQFFACRGQLAIQHTHPPSPHTFRRNSHPLCSSLGSEKPNPNPHPQNGSCVRKRINE